MIVDVLDGSEVVYTIQTKTTDFRAAETEAVMEAMVEGIPFTHARIRFESGEQQTTIFDCI